MTSDPDNSGDIASIDASQLSWQAHNAISDPSDRRSPRPADFQAENEALLAMADAMQDAPLEVLHRLARLAAELCRADSAGVSVLDRKNDQQAFRPLAVVGAVPRIFGELTARNSSPCSAAIDQNSAVVLTPSKRAAGAWDLGEPAATEALVIPIRKKESEARAVLWVLLQEDQRHFDAEDVRILTRLSRMAAPAVSSLADTIGLESAQSNLQDAATSLRDAAQDSLILESITDAFYAIGRDWTFTYINHRGEELLRRTRADVLGKNIWVEFAPTVGTALDHAYRRAMDENVPVSLDYWYYPPYDRWYEVHAYPSADGISVYFRDVNDRKRAEAGHLNCTVE